MDKLFISAPRRPQRVSQPAAASVTRHYPLLDGLRGLAAVAVLVYHSKVYTGRSLAPGSYLAVDFFFVLSGFVMAHAYVERIRNGMKFRDYSCLRLIRLWPTYALGLAIGFMGLALPTIAHRHWSDLVKLSAMLAANFLYMPTPTPSDPQLFTFVGSAWSLFYELVANVVLFVVARSAGLKVMASLTAVSLFALVCLALHGVSVDSGSHIAGAPMALARVGFSFFAGVLVYGLGFNQRHHPEVPAIAALAISAALAAIFLPLIPAALVTARDLFCVVVVFPLLVYIAAATIVPDSWAHPVRFSADISYPLYVLHLPVYGIILTVLRHALRGDEAYQNSVFLATAPVTIIVVSWVWAQADARLRARLKLLVKPSGGLVSAGSAR